jgi:hypothetical protein
LKSSERPSVIPAIDNEDFLFDVEAFDHDLDNPVAIGEPVPVILEIADLDQRQKPFGVEGGWFRFLDALEPGGREFVSEPGVVLGQTLLFV